MAAGETVSVGDTLQVEITRLGALGDGVGALDDRQVFVPFTVPGDVVTARVRQVNSKIVRAQVVDILEKGAGRIEAPCRHFTRCGGCDLQHVGEDPYYAFKKGLLEEAVERAGFSSSAVQEPIRIGSGKRRRVELKVRASRGTAKVGFYARQSHRLVDISHCPVMDPQLEKLLPGLKDTISRMRKPQNIKAIHLVRSNTGIDALFVAEIPPREEQILKQFCAEADLARISWSFKPSKAGSGETVTTIMHTRPVQMRFGRADVDMPVNAFLQATESGQRAITKIIVEATSDSTRVADLYAGCGTYTFPLLDAGHIVTSFEGTKAMVKTIRRTFHRSDYGSRSAAIHRDLYREPVSGAELNDFDAVVLNPPRSGAEPQIAAIASSEVPLVVLVSCNPRALERDARHLAEHNYELQSAVPVDQFHWTVHLESVAVFRKTDSMRSIL